EAECRGSSDASVQSDVSSCSIGIRARQGEASSLSAARAAPVWRAHASSPTIAAVTARSRFRSRLVAGVLAFLVGFSGAHRRYLGSRWWPVYPLIALPGIGLALRFEPWYRHPGFFVAALVVVAAMLEAI